MHRRSIFSALLVCVLLAGLTLSSMSLAQEQGEPLWSAPYDVLYVSVSADGSVVAAVTSGQELLVLDGDGRILWTWPEGGLCTGVAVSDDGNVVAVTAEDPEDFTLKVYYWKNAKSLSGSPGPDWISPALTGYMEAKCISLSSNGNEVAVLDEEGNVYYWKNALTLSGVSPTTWNSTGEGVISSEYEVVVSKDGDRVVALYTYSALRQRYYTIRYYTGASGLSGVVTPTSSGSDITYALVAALDLSSDGRYAVYSTGDVVRFADVATGNILWNSTEILFGTIEDVCVSDDGNTVVALVDTEAGAVVAIFKNALANAGSNNVSPTIVSDFIPITPVSMDTDGSCSKIAIISYGALYMLDGDGNILWYYTLPLGQSITDVKVSGDGSCVVMGSWTPLATLYYFSLVEPFVGGHFEIGGAPSTLFPALIVSLGVLAMALLAMSRR